MFKKEKHEHEEHFVVKPGACDDQVRAEMHTNAMALLGLTAPI